MMGSWGRQLALVETESPRSPSSRHKTHRRWRSSSGDSFSDLVCAVAIPLAPAAVVSCVASYAGLALRLWWYLGLGGKWLIQAFRLVVYAALLLPGFVQMILYYFFSPRVKRDIAYGRKPRQLLDLYIPEGVTPDAPAPVVVFVTGGAWTIGYKAWGATLARRLCDAGIMVACLDYRNFPQADALQMLEDVNAGISWVSRRIDRFGGDPASLALVGQSAGGQLALLALLSQAAQAAAGEAVLGAAPVWHPAGVRAFVGVSGAYDLEGLAEHLHRRGLYRELLDTIMTVGDTVAYGTLSPLAAARALARADPGVARFAPPALLLHGTADKSVPPEGSAAMGDALRQLGIPCTLQLYEGKTHTDFLLEDAFKGGKDTLADEIISLVTGRAADSDHPRMVPAPLVRLAARVCPF